MLPIGKSLDAILPMLADRGIAYQFVEYEADGHVFPDDFAGIVLTHRAVHLCHSILRWAH